MASAGFFSLVKEEPDSGHEMETTPVALPPNSASMGGHTPPGSGGRHVACPPLQSAMPIAPITPNGRQPPLRRMDIDPNFEPVARSRSNTWPLPCPEGYVENEEPVAVSGEGAVVDQVRPTGTVGGLADAIGGPPKKNTSRRNPWGNMSYADLIAQAIMSSPEGRATLSQIYDWMVQNVPYFKDKGDSNSSAGWKNSIRHNLSLHNRFMRVQNEGTGKSSWWVLNPDAKPGKSTRRRANTMEGGRYEKKRGRVKKKLEVLRSGLDTTPPPSSSMNENLEMYPDSPHTHGVHPAYSHLSPQDYRPRASSNASSCGGRLSPIPGIESDMHDSQVPPMSPGLGSWPGDYWPHHPPHPHAHPHPHDRYADQLVDSMGEGLKLGPNDTWVGPGRIPNPQDCLKLSQLSPHPPNAHLNGYIHNHHNHHPQGFNAFEEFHRYGPHTPHGAPFPHPPAPHPPLPHQEKIPNQGRPHPHNNYSLTNLQALSPAHSVHSLSPTQPLGEGHYPGPGGEAHQPNNFPTPPSSQASQHSASTNDTNMLRAALTHREQQHQQQQQQRQQQQGTQNHSSSPGSSDSGASSGPSSSGGGSGGSSGGGGGGGGGGGSGGGGGGSGGSSGQQGHMQDFADFDTPIHGGLDCNVEEVIKHELQVEGNLDFSFPQAHHAHHGHPHLHAQAVAHSHAHGHHHGHIHPHGHPDASQMATPPGMPYQCSSIAAAGNQWVR